MAKLENMKRNTAAVFSSRNLFIAVNQLLANFTFKLTIRRVIIGMFSQTAKLIDNDKLNTKSKFLRESNEIFEL